MQLQTDSLVIPGPTSWIAYTGMCVAIILSKGFLMSEIFLSMIQRYIGVCVAIILAYAPGHRDRMLSCILRNEGLG